MPKYESRNTVVELCKGKETEDIALHYRRTEDNTKIVMTYMALQRQIR